MGRFPSLQLLQKPEAQGLYDIFYPVCRIFQSGDYLAFRDYFATGTSTAQWFLGKGLLYQMRNRCEALVWRSLIRKVFIFGGFHGDPSAQRAPPPMLHLSKVETAVQLLQARHKEQFTVELFSKGGANAITIRLPEDSDYDGVAGLASKARDPDVDDYLLTSGYYDENGAWVQNPDRQLIEGPEYEQYTDSLDNLYPEIHGRPTQATNASNLLQEIESIVSSLIKQNLLGGYLTHNPARFVIPGAKHVGALAKGFPNVWQVISSQQQSYGEEVPAWIIARQALPSQPAVGGPGGGRVINLKGAKAVGS
jgi:nuclear mRNA export protein PCID2/THP1